MLFPFKSLRESEKMKVPVPFYQNGVQQRKTAKEKR